MSTSSTPEYLHTDHTRLPTVRPRVERLTIPAQDHIRLGLLIDASTTDVAQRGRVETAKTYLKRLRYFVTWLRVAQPADGWTATLLERYRAHLGHHFASPLTRNGYLVAVRCFGTFLQKLGYADHNPGEHVKGWGTERKPRRHHLPMQDAKLFVHAGNGCDQNTGATHPRCHHGVSDDQDRASSNRSESSDAAGSQEGRGWVALSVHGKGRRSKSPLRIIRRVRLSNQ